MYKCQFGVVKNRHILDSLIKFLFFFLKSDKAEIMTIIIKVKNEKSFFRENSLVARILFFYFWLIYI